MNLKGKKIAVLGLHDNGIAMLKGLHKIGGLVSGYGTASPKDREIIRQSLKDIRCPLFFDHEKVSEDALTQYDLIVITPGEAKYLKALEFAKKRKITVMSDLDLACPFMKAPIIAVAGTNGKTSVVYLIREMLRKQGYKVAVWGGEFGLWGECVADQTKYDYHLLELSSWRLEKSSQLKPHIAVLLNLFPSHADCHEGGYPAYIEAHAKLFAHQTERDFLVHEATAPNMKEFIQLHPPAATRVLFPLDLDSDKKHPGIAIRKQELRWLSPSGEKEIYSLEKVPTKILLHFLNLMPAVAVAHLCQVSPPYIQNVLNQFVGLPSRMQLIRVLKDIYFIDDAQATNIGATAWALNSFTSPMIWIGGGRLVEGNRLEDLPQFLKSKIKSILLIGLEREKIAEKLKRIAPLTQVESIKEAVDIAHKTAEMEDAVIFSPACPPDLHTNADLLSGEFSKAVAALPNNSHMVKTKRKFLNI